MNSGPREPRRAPLAKNVRPQLTPRLVGRERSCVAPQPRSYDMSHTSLPVLALSVAAFSLASGQGLESGVRVRLSAPSLGMRMYTGTLRGREARQLLVDTLTVPLHAL